MTKIVSSKLTTSEVVDGGQGIRLDMLDQAGEAVSVVLPFDHAQSVAMTLPRLLSQALQVRAGQPGLKYVFTLGHWSLESVQEKTCLLLTLSTDDGFQATFGLPFDVCQAMGWALHYEGKRGLSNQQVADGKQATFKVN